ncbi:MAG: hypothetical protein A2075_25360 [Geobacteraceae bacterium GWC2_58_44]|nr:MAG: hypothetical protein A2075_25360 [Geobacteraceae bacterium GWC2_58_44]HBG06186.1 hypothetical protein [Geobacter sp.]
MFDWFRKKREVLTFPDNASAFAHACAIGYVPLINALIPALVEEEGGRGPEGEHTYQITLALSGGVQTLWSATLKESLSYPREGDLVGFRVYLIADDMPEPVNLIGFIGCRLEPVFVEGRGWVVAQSYTPRNIKQAIRL